MSDIPIDEVDFSVCGNYTMTDTGVRPDPSAFTVSDTSLHVNTEVIYCDQDIKIKYFGDTKPLEKIEKGDWIDLCSRKLISGWAGDFIMIPLGVAMKLPEGYEAILAPRSSSFMKYGFIQTNGIGVIDNSYSGDNDEWCLPAYFIKDSIIEPGTRIAQFRIQPCQPNLRFTTVETLGDEDRGGFGSTGD